MKYLQFEATQEDGGGFSVRCLTESIFAQADVLDCLEAEIREAIAAFYFDAPQRVAYSVTVVFRGEVQVY